MNSPRIMSNTQSIVGLCALVWIGWFQATGQAQVVFETDFAKAGFEEQGWQVGGDWDLFEYPVEQGKKVARAARFAANKPNGKLTRTFETVSSEWLLSFDYGWGWGNVDQASDGIAWMLLDANDSGYIFEIHRVRAQWAVQWAKVAKGVAPHDKHWADEEIDATHVAVRDGGGLCPIVVEKRANGSWQIRSDDWNHGKGATFAFQDSEFESFSKLVLLGTQNFDEQVFNHVRLERLVPKPTTAIAANEFLNSIGIVTTFPDRGQPLSKTVEMIRYCGFRWVRGGIEGLSDKGPTTIETYLDLHKQTGAKINWGLVSGGTDLKKLLETARRLAADDALLAIEGNNEPNNWGVTYQGEQGGGGAPSWKAVAKLQRDLYAAVKSDPVLKHYPVWSISESGGQTDNVGLQFLKIPEDADTKMPSGTQYADFANVHNYVYHPNSSGLEDNKTWNASDPSSACRVDGLSNNFGETWAKKFQGYSQRELQTLPRVTTETGCTIDGPITEQIQALHLLSLYLDQFKRGWKYTSVYLLRDREDEAGNQSFGFFQRDYSPRTAAHYLHNLTTILGDRESPRAAKQLMYEIAKQPATMHDLLLQKHDGSMQLVIWNERVQGSDTVLVRFEQPLREIAIYDPTLGTEPIRMLQKVDRIELTLSNHPLVLSIIDR